MIISARSCDFPQHLSVTWNYWETHASSWRKPFECGGHRRFCILMPGAGKGNETSIWDQVRPFLILPFSLIFPENLRLREHPGTPCRPWESERSLGNSYEPICHEYNDG